MAAPRAVTARLKSWTDGLANQPHLNAVRDGVVGALPLILVGSLFLLLAQPPSAWLAARLAPYEEMVKIPYRMLSGVLALYVGFACAHSLASRYGLDALAAGLTAVASYLCALSPAALAPQGGQAGGWGLAADRLGASGMFGAMAIAIGSVELTRFFARRRWTVKLPGGAPEAIVRSFAALVPTLASIVLAWLVAHVLGFDVVGLVGALARPLKAAGNSLPGAWAVVLIDSGMWLLGMHPAAALAAFKPVWLQMLAENQVAFDHHLLPPNLGGHELFLWFVWQGGSGGTLGLALLLLRARSATLKGIGKLGLVPAIFNINEPLLFGLPIVLNGTLAAPFVAAPLATATLSWLAMHWGWVARPIAEVTWTLPAPIGAYATTGWDARAIALELVNLALTMAIYFPFIRRYDRRLVAREQAEAAPSPAASAA